MFVSLAQGLREAGHLPQIETCHVCREAPLGPTTKGWMNPTLDLKRDKQAADATEFQEQTC